QNRPAGVVGTLVGYMETVQRRAMWRIGMPAAMSGSSNVNEHPITKLTRSARHRPTTSDGSRPDFRRARRDSRGGRFLYRGLRRATAVPRSPVPTPSAPGQGFGLA